MTRAVVVFSLCACRIGFDPLPRTAGSDAAMDTGDRPFMTITFGERPTSQRKNVTADTTLVEFMPTQNNGGADDLALEETPGNTYRGLVRFDLTSIAPGSEVRAARLALGRIDYGDEASGPVVIKLLVESWTAGTSDGAVGPGATWQSRDGVQAWMTPGGTTAGAIATKTPDGLHFTLELPPAVVQSWVDTPTANFGVLVAVASSPAHYHLHQSDSLVDVTLRPELAIEVAQ